MPDPAHRPARETGLTRRQSLALLAGALGLGPLAAKTQAAVAVAGVGAGTGTGTGSGAGVQPVAHGHAPRAAAAQRRPERPPRPVRSPTGVSDPLPAALRRLLQGSGLPLSSIGLCIQPADAQAAPLASHNAELAYQLASTAKVVTALAALDLLGPAYCWRTPAFVTGPLVDGQLMGDLVLLGGGDALLSTEDLLAWFGRMRAQGLHEVRGNIVLDRLAFRLTDGDMASTPPPGPDRPHHAWPAALMLDEGRLRLQLRSAGGRAPQVELVPPVAGLRLDSQLQRGGGCQVQAQLQSDRPGQLANRLVLRGQWGEGCGQRELQVAPWPHEVYTLRAVDALWRQAGGRVRGRVASASADGAAAGVVGSPGHTLGQAQSRPHDQAREHSYAHAKTNSDPRNAWPRGPDGRPLQAWSVHRSEPLPQLLRDMNKASDNLAARNLMLSLAPGFPLRAATLPGARDRVQAWLRDQGLAADDILVDSGSGLSREERGKPRAMVQLLRQAWQGPQRQDFVGSLPVAGVDGTLQHRMTRGPAAGRAFLKTGTLLDTRALAGYVLGRSGRPYAVAALVNHPEAQRALPMLDNMVQWLANQA